MPTPLEAAKAREARKLAQAGLNPDGSVPGGEGGGGGGGDPGDEGDDGRNFDPAGDRPGGGDPTAAEIAELRRQMAALQGRVAPAQRDAEDFKRLWQSEQQARTLERQQLQERIETLEQQNQARQEQLSIDSLLTEEEKRDIDPLVLQAITKIASAAAKSQIPKVDAKASVLEVLEQRERDRVVMHRANVLNDPTRGLHHLAQLAYDPAFIAWSQEDENDVDSVVSSLMNAKSTEEVDRYAKIVSKRIATFRAKSQQPQDARTNLGQHMRRGEAPRMTQAEMTAKLNEAKQLSRSSSPADRARAKAIFDSLPS